MECFNGNNFLKYIVKQSCISHIKQLAFGSAGGPIQEGQDAEVCLFFIP